jgi:hypothetical protein
MILNLILVNDSLRPDWGAGKRRHGLSDIDMETIAAHHCHL